MIAQTPLTLPRLRAIPTFLGAPIGDIEDLRPGDVAMVGLFLDHGDDGRFGKRFAARQVRYASTAQGMKPPVGERGRCFDLGDLNVFPLQPERQAGALRRQIELITGTGAVVCVVGGRSLPPILDAFSCTISMLQDAASHRNVSVGGDRLAVILDLAPILRVDAEPRGLARIVRHVRSVPADQVDAVHICGLAPDLDVAGRYEASLGAHVLEVVAAHLVGGEPCR